GSPEYGRPAGQRSRQGGGSGLVRRQIDRARMDRDRDGGAALGQHLPDPALDLPAPADQFLLGHHRPTSPVWRVRTSRDVAASLRGPVSARLIMVTTYRGAALLPRGADLSGRTATVWP